MNRLLEISTFCALVLTLVACVDTIPIENGPVESMIVLEGDLAPSKRFEVKLSTSAGYHDVSTVAYPKNAKVNITWGDVDDNVWLVYSEDCECYYDNSRPSKNILYTINAYFEEDDMPQDVISRTKIPPTSIIDSSRNEILELSNEVSKLRSSMIIDTRNGQDNYYHVIPFRYELEKYGPNDEPQYKRTTGEKQYLRLAKSHTDHEVYVEQLDDQEGFLVDMNNLNDDDALVLDFELETPHAINTETDKFKDVYYELRSVNEAYYRYNLYRSREQSATTGNQVSPAISYSNINYGLGFFGGYSSKIDSFLVY